MRFKAFIAAAVLLAISAPAFAQDDYTEFVSKEDFDTWITAADWTIFPYLATSSSGVLARTRLLQRPAIISAVGGLPNQAAEPDLLFTTDEELVDILQLAAMATDRLT